jgi:ribosomal protein S18 acetylase RimI-like enzyme
MDNCFIERCDFKQPEHVKSLIDLLNHYMEDPMGDHPVLTPEEQVSLVDGLSKHPGAFVLFLSYEGRRIGMVTCFELFSTFNVKPYLYIHDVVIHADFRGKGLGRSMMEQVIAYANGRGCCKVTLEVREDNPVAQQLYSSLGFEACTPNMLFWTKKLNQTD